MKEDISVPKPRMQASMMSIPHAYSCGRIILPPGATSIGASTPNGVTNSPFSVSRMSVPNPYACGSMLSIPPG
ncbi:MAG: hypothetical protein JWO97_3317 [Acidobacteria bacterium]|nr:hypothetical protein [Acidobacteriota bacterium]